MFKVSSEVRLDEFYPRSPSEWQFLSMAKRMHVEVDFDQMENYSHLRSLSGESCDQFLFEQVTGVRVPTGVPPSQRKK